jgi:tetratricopeptide (TPR) repeat protein
MKRNHILAITICAIICIAAILGISTLSTPTSVPNPADSFNSAGKLYSDSVDLANAGKYTAALQAADQALAQNVSSLMPVIQANRAGILVMLGRNEDAIAAADAALGAQGNLTTTHSIAWFNKGNALRALGKTAEAKEAYAQATALDPTFTNPYQT